jgi:hypothetical protein
MVVGLNRKLSKRLVFVGSCLFWIGLAALLGALVLDVVLESVVPQMWVYYTVPCCLSVTLMGAVISSHFKPKN